MAKCLLRDEANQALSESLLVEAMSYRQDENLASTLGLVLVVNDQSLERTRYATWGDRSQC